MKMTAITPCFNPDVDFCPDCGTLLPPLRSQGDISCLACRRVVEADLFHERVMSYTVKFNKVENPRKEKKEEDVDGPVVERRCPKCGHEKMSYAAVQLRSADEGQTVFFTCLKCKFKESENS